MPDSQYSKRIRIKSRAVGRSLPEPAAASRVQYRVLSGRRGWSHPTRVQRLSLQMRLSRAELAPRLERRRVCKVAAELERERRGWAEWGCAREKPASCELSGEEGGKGSEFRFLNGGWVEQAGAARGPAGHTLSGPEVTAVRPAMAGERTRRFTRSLLRPGQAAELRHSAASAAAVAVSNRQLQRVSAARPSRHGRACQGIPGRPPAL